jgi:hypothetical protein
MTKILGIYELGNAVGPWIATAFILIIAGATVYCMKKYL